MVDRIKTFAAYGLMLANVGVWMAVARAAAEWLR
jgi:hypothetical protein